MYNVAESEVVAFKNFDTPDIYYEFYPQVYTGKRGKCLFHSVKNMSLTLSSKLQYLLCTKDKTGQITQLSPSKINDSLFCITPIFARPQLIYDCFIINRWLSATLS